MHARTAVYLLVLGLAVVLASAGVCTAATTLTVGVTDVARDSATITWSKTQDWCFDHYEVQHRESSGGSWVTDSVLSDANTVRVTVTGLAAGRAYEARVNDVDCGGSQASNVEPFTTQSALPGFGAADLLIALGAAGAAVGIGRSANGALRKG